MSTDMHPPTADLRLPKVLAALADPVRLSAIRTLAVLGESPCNELHRVARLTVNHSTFSHHQRVLREAGIINVDIRGSRRVLSLRGADLDACFPGLLTAVLATPDALVGAAPA